MENVKKKNPKKTNFSSPLCELPFQIFVFLISLLGISFLDSVSLIFWIWPISL